MDTVTEVGTRERIVQIALDLFERQGYAGTSLRDIADRMGVTKAALYYHFPSKEALLDRVLAPALSRVREVLVDVPADRAGLVSRLVDVAGDVGPQILVAISDPAIAAHLSQLAGGVPLPQQVADALAGPLPADPDEAAVLRVRAACAVACLPAGIHAFRQSNPTALSLDPATRVVIERAMLAVLRSD
ncbi:MAG: TetR family transcriptional regulator [Georgenia sp.]